ncbi:hypothetical protein [Microbacterium candidum]|uniref:Uncharacterized protein n=1 Tax=Microbacterium candidum TaxID=3041922 RepID=A0ABT7N406_9MICO|nr:hypothetical protein [Microbacterium sp. ASV49]MDL9981429.1 hypothetical protein [Microbacterium sp. ASV49]
MTDIDRPEDADTPAPAEEARSTRPESDAATAEAATTARQDSADAAHDRADDDAPAEAGATAPADANGDADAADVEEDAGDVVDDAGTDVADADAVVAAPAEDAVPPQYGVGPFSVREVALALVWLFAFITSFFDVAGDQSVWTGGLAWILTIGVPTVAVFLIVLRRLSPTGIRRVGSLGIDQFASVAFAVAAVLWIQEIWATIANAMTTGFWSHTWVMWVQAVLMLLGVVLTVAAKWLPVIGDDFRYRVEVVAQPAARPTRPVTPRPVVERPKPVETATIDEYAAAVLGTDAGAVVGTETVAEAAHAATSEPAVQESRRQTDDVRSDAETVAVPVAASQAFWALVPVERDVVDEHGVPLFRIGPTAWALVIEDRGSTYVVRNDDGRIGYLRDVSGVTRG